MIRLISVVVLIALAGCGTEPMRKVQELLQPSKGQQFLSAGLKQYEEGHYSESQKSLQSALQQGVGDNDRVTAYKHLAFIHCVSNREQRCRDDFRRALAIDPSMDLAPEEADHPVWGRVFRSVKAGR